MSPFTLLVVRSLEESQERSEKLLQGLKELREIFSLDVQRFSEFFKLLAWKAFQDILTAISG